MASDMASELHDRLQQAIELIQAGRRDEARPLLEAIVAADPSQELAWLWLASISANRAERIGFLRRALALNPTNETTRAAYARLTGETPAGPPVEPPAAPLAPVPAVRRSRMTPGGFLTVLAFAAVAVAVVLVALYLRDSNNEEADASPAATRVPPASLTPTASYSSTPSPTSRPTVTPGPSPTSIWDSALPTWTAQPTWTAAPTRQIATWTPRPPSATPLEPAPESPLDAPQETPTSLSPALTGADAEQFAGRVSGLTGRNWAH